MVQTAAYAEAIVRDVGEEPGKIGALHRLLALDVVQLSFGGQPIVEQRVDLIQVSADAGNGLDPRDRADDKLAGLQLAHFGAFYKQSWRANDWMWGRHDAVQRLAQILLEPARLRQLGYDVKFVADTGREHRVRRPRRGGREVPPCRRSAPVDPRQGQGGAQLPEEVEVR